MRLRRVLGGSLFVVGCTISPIFAHHSCQEHGIGQGSANWAMTLLWGYSVVVVKLDVFVASFVNLREWVMRQFVWKLTH